MGACEKAEIGRAEDKGSLQGDSVISVDVFGKPLKTHECRVR